MLTRGAVAAPGPPTAGRGGGGVRGAPWGCPPTGASGCLFTPLFWDERRFLAPSGKGQSAYQVQCPSSRSLSLKAFSGSPLGLTVNLGLFLSGGSLSLALAVRTDGPGGPLLQRLRTGGSGHGV